MVRSRRLGLLDYFRLRKPIERRVYEIVRKHRGKQDYWKISLELLKKKTGSRMTMKGFRHAIKRLAEGDHYAVHLNEADSVEFTNRGTMLPKVEEHQDFPVTDPETYNDARIVSPSYDVYYLERSGVSGGWTAESRS